MKILIIEDNYNIANQVAGYLNQFGFITKIEHDGEEGLFECENGQYDAVILDLGLPKIDGITILRKLRKKEKNLLPIIILTARDSKKEIIDGLEAGADDYIVKPFDVEEVLARLRSVIRRHKNVGNNLARCNNVILDIQKNQVKVDEQVIELTRTEFLMLQYLFINQGKTIGVTEISEHVYHDFDNDSKIIAKHIANIRKKIGKDIIQTDSNRGYYVPFSE